MRPTKTGKSAWVVGCCGWAIAGVLSALASEPHWIWSETASSQPTTPEVVHFRKAFNAPPLVWFAVLNVAADDRAVVFLNGREVVQTDSWEEPARLEVAVRLNQGENVIAIRAENESGPAGVLVRLAMVGARGEAEFLSDDSWRVSSRAEPGWNVVFDFDDGEWGRAVSLGELGVPPWGDVLNRAVATPAESLKVLKGFDVSLVRSAEPEEGSWICMTVDHQGRLIISPEADSIPLLRFTLTPKGKVAGIEPIAKPLRHAMGLLYAFDSLYVNGHGPEGTGLYRVIDENGDDQFDESEVHLIKNFAGEGEHGYHAVVAGPNGGLYVLNGNATRLPEGLADSSPHRNYSGDVLPLGYDAEEPAEEADHGGKSYGAPGGYIARTDPEGKKWELLLAGFRNPYDFAISPEGEIFTFDSDLEWDWGAPWYRPNRVCHCVSGAEFGWRDWIYKWPADYPDSLPSVVDVGLGSPTGLKFGAGSNFPDKYRRALFVQDWSYGRILAVHLEPKGATYTGAYETFLEGRPLNLTDLEFGPDGAMYFITGGRGTQSGLYRVSYTGRKSRAPRASAVKTPGARAAEEARGLRRKLEAYHGHAVEGAADILWPHLDAPDSWIRYAARIALESQPLDQWRERALGERRARASLTALLALARLGRAEDQPGLLRALNAFHPILMNEAQTLAWLRVFQVSLSRHGDPGAELREQTLRRIDPLFPSATWALNRELCRLLVYLRAPRVAPRALALIESHPAAAARVRLGQTALVPERAAAQRPSTPPPTQEEQIHYIAMLRRLSEGWTLDERKAYFGWFKRDRDQLPHPPELMQWFADVDRDYAEGAHLHLILNQFRAEAVETLTDSEREVLAALLEPDEPELDLTPSQDREFVSEWTTADFVGELDKLSSGRNFERGRRAFIDAQCLACHRFAGNGGAVGPELDGVAGKYALRDILESVTAPSKILSEQYQNITIVTFDEDEYTGMPVAEDEETLTMLVNPLTQLRMDLAREDIERRYVSTVSPMPEGLIWMLEKEDILDLLAYLISGGKRDAACFESAEP